jgi:hypothetical protein
MGAMRNLYNILVEKPKGKEQLGRPRNSSEDNNEIDHRGTGWETVD